MDTAFVFVLIASHEKNQQEVGTIAVGISFAIGFCLSEGLVYKNKLFKTSFPATFLCPALRPLNLNVKA